MTGDLIHHRTHYENHRVITALCCTLICFQNKLGHAFNSFVIIIDMMVGDFDFENMLKGGGNLRFDFMSWVLSVVIVIIVATVIMNLLVRLSMDKEADIYKNVGCNYSPLC